MVTSPAARSAISIGPLIKAHKNKGQAPAPGPAIGIVRSDREKLNRPLDARGACKLPLLEALLAEHRTSLRRPERHRGVFAARRAGGLGLHALTHRRSGGRAIRALGLAHLAPLRLVLELLVSEEQLLAGRPDELVPAVHAPEALVLELHRSLPRARHSSRRVTPIRAGASFDSASSPVPAWPAVCRPASDRRNAS